MESNSTVPAPEMNTEKTKEMVHQKKWGGIIKLSNRQLPTPNPKYTRNWSAHACNL